MKTIAIFKSLMLVMFFSAAVNAQTTVYEVKSHSLRVEGTSNLHDWHADVEKMKGTLKFKVEDGKIADLEGLTIEVDARSFKASRGNIMNSKINDALNSKKFPAIKYELTKVNSLTEKSGVYTISTTGQLFVSGVARTVTIEAEGRQKPDGSVEFTGSQTIRMSDYNVSPPTAMFGALTTGDQVTLKYSVVLQTGIVAEGK